MLSLSSAGAASIAARMSWPGQAAAAFSVSAGRWGRGAGGRGRRDDGGGGGFDQDQMSLEADEERGIFRRLDIGKPDMRHVQTGPPRRRFNQERTLMHREKEMSPYQDWASVWPGARTFQPSVVPLPVRQGFVQLKNQVHPDKYANAELMKVPNFLHLTPPVVKRQARMLREKFCTPWPKGNVSKTFPCTRTTSTYLNASSSLRDMRARVVSVSVPVPTLRLDAASHDKLIRLLGRGRYDAAKDVLRVVADSCPYRQQNSDYCDYLVTALYFESRKRETWEAELRREEDQHEFDWEMHGHQPASPGHAESAKRLLNVGEADDTLRDYKQAVVEHLKLKPMEN